MITVWGRATSVNVQTVIWALAELGLACERHDVGGAFGGNDTPDFLAMNPNGLVPVLRDGDGPFLWESAAIVRYLGAGYGDGQFWPVSPTARATVDKWAEWIKTSFGPAFLTGIFWPSIAVPEAKRDLAAIAAAEKRLKTLAAMLDARLAEGAYLGGEDVCFADMVVGAPLYRYYTLDFERADTPNLRAYYERLTARPAYAEHVMVSYDSLRAK
ncbi:glutathione S-transferase family protein [Kumtagia ephedrae]|uniref:Glutathione S-transferase n=1 Tax=Kumtagia ephedrae TaxID=2116701 RepID=A0A2P7RVT6_9HYPH|nr:glutathione S-transferase family protein [Mesorhizobium ephedrae]PSJ54316.1 glutathione S-transferase [Mesorhizobium ephedrae]